MQARDSIPVDSETARELIAAHFSAPYTNIALLSKLTPEKTGGRAGWKDFGYDGDVADWYYFNT